MQCECISLEFVILKVADNKIKYQKSKTWKIEFPFNLIKKEYKTLKEIKLKL